MNFSDEPRANTLINEEKPKLLPLKSGDKGFPSSPWRYK